MLAAAGGVDRRHLLPVIVRTVSPRVEIADDDVTIVYRVPEGPTTVPPGSAQ